MGRRTSWCAAVVAASVLMAACGRVADDGARASDAPTTVAPLLEAVSVRCGRTFGSDGFPTLEAVEVTPTLLGDHQCEPDGSARLAPGGRRWIIASGRDRDAMLWAPYARPDGPAALVELRVPASGCATTDEFRGEMALVVASERRPTFSVRTTEVGCGG